MFFFRVFLKICLLQADPKWTRRSVGDGAESAYMYKDHNWISYDTIENIQKRAAYVVAKSLGGLFVWSCMSSVFLTNSKIIFVFLFVFSGYG